MHRPRTGTGQHPSCSFYPFAKENGSDGGQVCRRLRQSHPQGPISMVKGSKARSQLLPLRSCAISLEI